MAKETPRKSMFKTSLSDRGSKALVAVAALVLVLGFGIAWASLKLFAPGEAGASSASRAPSNVDTVTAGEEDAEMTELLAQEDQRRASEAEQGSQSMVATLTAMSQTDPSAIPPPRTGPASRGDTSSPSEDDLMPPTRSQPQQQQQQQSRSTQQRTQRAASSQPREVNSQMTNEIQQIMGAMALNETQPQVYAASAEQPAAAQATNANATPDDAQGADAQPAAMNAATVAPLVSASEVLYGVMEIGADSDTPGPVKARIVSGELRGARLLGSFQRADDQLRIEFETLILPGERAMSIEAVAVNPNDRGIGLATYVNRHYVKRYGGLILGGFVETFGDAVANSGSTTVVSPFGSVTTTNDEYNTEEQLLIAAGGGAAAVGGELQQLANTPPTVRVAANTPIGVFFLDDVMPPGS